MSAPHRYRKNRLFTLDNRTTAALDRLVRAGLFRNASRAVDAAVAAYVAELEARGELPIDRTGERDDDDDRRQK